MALLRLHGTNMMVLPVKSHKLILFQYGLNESLLAKILHQVTTLYISALMFDTTLGCSGVN